MGPPAADLAIEGDIVVRPSKKDLEGYPGFQFGQADETVEPVRKPLEASTTTDAQGCRAGRDHLAAGDADGQAARSKRHPALT
ncbi:MAG: hypothetical protein WDN31_10830 [Hyphomicrobium sp.]